MSSLAVAFFAFSAAGQDAPKDNRSAEDIVKAVAEKGAFGFKQGSAQIEMKVTKKSGSIKSNTMTVKAMRSDGLLRSMVRFDKPVKIAGMSFLVRQKKDALPDQYVYIPAAKVVRRIAAGNAGSSFFGSDFTYGDLMPLPTSQADKVSLKRLPDALVGGQPVNVVEITPKVEGSPYGKLVVSVHSQKLTPLKIEFFDPKMAPLKTLSTKKLKKIDEELIPVEMEMVNLQKGSKTLIRILEMNPKAELSDSDFTEEAMQR